MFDYINCRHPLPDGHNPAGERYQTKDTPNQYCDTYIIQENGTLTQDDKLVDFHGDLNFYACNVSGSGPKILEIVQDGSAGKRLPPPTIPRQH